MGRWRSAVSRAYYSAFLALKDRLIAARPTDFPKEFPEKDVHRKLGAAIKAVLGSAPGSIADRLSRLSRARNDADYDWTTRLVHTDVNTHLGRAKQLRRDIDALDAGVIADIAQNLVMTERAERAARR
jgi:uncharacterized protein (UPF0332 family)